MSILFVDENKCRKDALCVPECPVGVLELDEQGYPRFKPGDAELCIECGHCVAVCPHGAIGIQGMAPEDCPPLDKNLKISLEKAAYLLKTRRSCRQYKKDLVPRPTLESLIDLASYGPSGHNRQPIEWLVISGQEKIARLAQLVVDWSASVLQGDPEPAQLVLYPRLIDAWEKGIDRLLRGAPHLLIAHAPEDERTAEKAAGQVAAYMELAASAMGLGSCWAGYFVTASQQYAPLMAHLDLPKGHMVYAAVMLGYPKAKYYRIPLRKKAKVQWR